MRFPARSFLYVCLAAACATRANAQTPQPPSPPQATDPQAVALLARSAAALRGNAPLSDVTLTGTARRIAGSDDESGQVTIKARATGQSRLDLTLPSGKHSESRNVSPAVGAGFSPSSSSATAAPSGQWTGPDGTAHDIAYHNLIAEPAWPSPAILLTQLLASPNIVVTNLGQETRDGTTVQHLSIAQTTTGTSDTDRLLQHLTQFDLYLDPATLLPASIAFNIHPDSNALLDLPVEIRFSDYRTINSTQIPFHIQKFLNNTLTLDLQFTNATLNSGLQASDFSL